MNRRVSRTGRQQAGGMLVEIMVSLLIFAFGLLGYTSMQARASVAEFEALQRSQALFLVDDMVSRISANRAAADQYVTNGLIGTGTLQDCAGLAAAALDLCEWGNLIRGSTETRNGARIGSMTQARGCIARVADTTHRFTVAVAWQGVSATAASPSPCGRGDSAYPNDALRRVYSATVCVARLRDPAVPAAVSRC